MCVTAPRGWCAVITLTCAGCVFMGYHGKLWLALKDMAVPAVTPLFSQNPTLSSPAPPPPEAGARMKEREMGGILRGIGI